MKEHVDPVLPDDAGDESPAKEVEKELKPDMPREKVLRDRRDRGEPDGESTGRSRNARLHVVYHEERALDHPAANSEHRSDQPSCYRDHGKRNEVFRVPLEIGVEKGKSGSLSVLLVGH